MKILGWMHSKIRGKTVSAAKKANHDHYVGYQDYGTEESDHRRPASGLLAIGTLGLNKNLQTQEGDIQSYATVSEHIISTLPQEEALEMSEKICSMIEDSDDDEEEYSYYLSGGERGGSVAVSRGIKSRDTSCTKKPISIILKKFYTRGFWLIPRVNHPFPEARIDKILRALLHKKIYQQSSSATVKKCLKNKPAATDAEMNNSDIKWIKTDSDYIVLEM